MGDGEDFETFYEREFASIAKAAWCVVLDEDLACQVAQEAFARSFQRWRRISGYDKPGAWTRRVAIRLAVRARDVGRREVDFAEAHDVQVGRSSSDGFGVREALAGVSTRQRAALVLHYLCDLPVTDVARELRCRPSTVRVHLHRGRQALRAHYEGDAHERR